MWYRHGRGSRARGAAAAAAATAASAPAPALPPAPAPAAPLSAGDRSSAPPTPADRRLVGGGYAWPQSVPDVRALTAQDALDEMNDVLWPIAAASCKRMSGEHAKAASADSSAIWLWSIRFRKTSPRPPLPAPGHMKAADVREVLRAATNIGDCASMWRELGSEAAALRPQPGSPQETQPAWAALGGHVPGFESALRCAKGGGGRGGMSVECLFISHRA